MRLQVQTPAFDTIVRRRFNEFTSLHAAVHELLCRTAVACVAKGDAVRLEELESVAERLQGLLPVCTLPKNQSHAYVTSTAQNDALDAI
eukprot:SAG11_NODE_1547_length_4713_cov_12.995232_3_plen_89_part_00